MNEGGDPRRYSVTLRVAVALLALGFFSCTSSGDETSPEPGPARTSPGQSPTEIVESRPVTDLTISPEDRVIETRSKWLTVTAGERFRLSTAIIAFERGDIPLRCIEDVTLRVQVGPGKSSEEVSVSVYPSNLVSPEDLREGQAVEVHGVLLDIKPKDEQLLVPDMGAVDYDVTEPLDRSL